MKERREKENKVININITKFLKNNIDQIHQDLLDCFIVVNRHKLSRMLYKVEVLKEIIDWMTHDEYERKVYER